MLVSVGDVCGVAQVAGLKVPAHWQFVTPVFSTMVPQALQVCAAAGTIADMTMGVASAAAAPNFPAWLSKWRRVIGSIDASFPAEAGDPRERRSTATGVTLAPTGAVIGKFW